jgi:hypothetical protein
MLEGSWVELNYHLVFHCYETGKNRKFVSNIQMYFYIGYRLHSFPSTEAELCFVENVI